MNGRRHGDPIADQAWLGKYSNAIVFTMADGCGWGVRSRDAAASAVNTLKEEWDTKMRNQKDTREIAKALLKSFSIADTKIRQGRDPWDVGTTTLISGALLQLKDVEPGYDHWGFVCCSVGDCKAYYYQAKTGRVSDITKGNRVTNTKDPGGRLGPYLKNKDGEMLPDLRNLALYFRLCKEGDIIFICTDGIHDNTDPEMLGKNPRDFKLDLDEWEDVPHDFLYRIKKSYKCKVFENLLKKAENATDVVECLRLYSWDTTTPSREWMESQPGQKLPPGFLGKLDHATCAAFVVPPFVPPASEFKKKSSKQWRGKK
eukprot:CAMPEP_0174261312 /NCGR_PEP_ID=MMETSP0439-20130205/11356_1 /TAXON_ID=0 /ORGANISM="Stereomyxa ramosa, Strain Chinc5" /LENGTH=314 /DNA_ID=CAMNT_0015345767 /DNA_START=1620 /DNA_END=2564 /DNA_ORIENTATION=-